MSWYNTIFTYSITSKAGTAYTLYFYPGYHTDLSSPSTVAFPKGTIKGVADLEGQLIVNRAFKEDCPMGIEQPVTMKFTVQPTFLTGTFNAGADNFSDVKKAIFRGGGGTNRTINGRSIFCPNRWKLLQGSTVIFDGIQDFVPDENYDRTDKGLSEIKIECTDIVTAALQRTLTTDCVDMVSSVTGTYLCNLFYTHGSVNFRCLYEKVDKTRPFNMSTIDQLYEEILSKAQNVLNAIQRSSTISLAIKCAPFVLAGTADGTAVITGMARTDNISIGMVISGTGVTVGTRVKSIDSNTQITVNANVTAGTNNYTFTPYNSLVTPYDLHGYYEQGATETCAQGDQIFRNTMYIVKGYNKKVTVDFYDFNVLVTKDTNSMVVADSSVYEVGDVLMIGYLTYQNSNPVVTDKPDGTHVEINGVFGITFTKASLAVRRTTSELTDGFKFTEYDSVYDYLNQEVFAKLGKGLIKFNEISNTYCLKILRVFDSWDTLGNTFTSDNVNRDKITVKRQANYYSEITSTLKDTGEDGIDEHKITIGGSENQKSLSLDNALQNDLLPTKDGKSGNSGSTLYLFQDEVYMNTIYELRATNVFVRLWHRVYIYLGNNVKDFTSSGSTILPTVNLDYFSDKLNRWINGTISTVGHIKEFSAYRMALTAATYLFGSEYSPSLGCEENKYTLEDNGNYIIGFDSDLIGTDYFDELPTRAFVTGIERDIMVDNNKTRMWLK